ncbi:Mitochondrial-processing peptidase subunit alpha [Armadillidium nasatum]|uniref:Mitochondrial-processing peptidase subunit alpha n=1 Tax=Armadillidium nasatum TaxID=96803 RepID=A0A5N5STY9_9CRUS|nr:Mitochondrial-processing peptidase subunit alpha [Armadillidium nasatum]
MLRKLFRVHNLGNLLKSSSRQCSSQSKTSPNVITPPAVSVKDSSSSTPITKLPLSTPVSWLPKAVYANVSELAKETQVTTLSNGLKVASEPKFGNFCTVGVLLDSGSRYEVAFPNTLIYATSVETTGLDKAIEILGDVILRPRFTEEEIQEARMAVSFDLEALQMRPEKDLILMEMIHAAAYRDNTLGLPKICPAENIMTIDRDTLFTYLKNHHTPERMVLAGVGVSHERLVEYAQKYFVDDLPIWEEDKSLSIRTSLKPDKSYAQYHWMHNATALNHAYIDTGIFCIHASAHPSYLADLAQVLTKEFVAMSSQITQDEFQRAKIQLQSMLLMNLESRPVVFEDVGRQVLATGKRLQPEYFIDLIKKVSQDDIVRVASQMLKSKPSVAAFGSLAMLPSLNDIESGLLDKSGRMPSKKSRFSLFR